MQSSQSSNSPQVKNKTGKFFSSAAVWILRILIGGVFILSGFVKSIDPWGSFYKIGEYFQVWGWDIPSPVIVFGAFLLGGFEFVLGCLLLLGCYRRSAPGLLLLMMAFMLPLTAYIMVVNPVSDCGCFGDFLILSNTETFLKNLVITAALIYLFIFNKKVGGAFVPYVQWIVGAWISLYILIIALYGFNVQPMIDFRRFSPGIELLTGENEGENESEAVYEFVYEKNGEKRNFTIDNLPDSTWNFVDRILISGDEGFSEGLSIIEDGEDIAEDVISTEGEQFIVTVPEMSAVDLSYTYLLNDLNDYIEARGGSMVALVSGDEADVDKWRDVSMASYPIYRSEATLLKELARGRAALIYLKDGIVQWKRSLSSISYSFVTETPYDEIAEELDPRPGFILNSVSAFFGLILLIIFLLDRSGKLVSWLIRRKHMSRILEKTTPKPDKNETETKHRDKKSE